VVKKTRGSSGKAEPISKTEDEPRKQVTVYLPPQQWRALKVVAAQEDREMSEIVSDALGRLGIK
jgi:hypothetical protein